MARRSARVPFALAVAVHDVAVHVAVEWIPALARSAAAAAAAAGGPFVGLAAAVEPAVVPAALAVTLAVPLYELDLCLFQSQSTGLEAVAGAVWPDPRLEECMQLLVQAAAACQ